MSIEKKKKRYALIGHPCSHSLSKRLFDETIGEEATYELIDIAEESELTRVWERYELNGFNVTSPYKQKIMDKLTRLTDSARAVGAVNCVKVEDDGTTTGYNTDAEAFGETIEIIYGMSEWRADSLWKSMIKMVGCGDSWAKIPRISNTPKLALILGTGGGAKAVATALTKLGIGYKMVSRHPDGDYLSYEEAYELAKEATLIVNATPVGMTSNESVWKRSELLSHEHLVYDLIYNPSPTRLLVEAKARRAQTMNGLGMLCRQAEISWEVWGYSRSQIKKGCWS